MPESQKPTHDGNLSGSKQPGPQINAWGAPLQSQHINETGIAIKPQFYDAKNQIGPASLNTIDVLLLLLCPLAADLGTLVSSALKKRQKNINRINDLIWRAFLFGLRDHIANIFAGIVLGLIIALFFVGTITPEITSLSRVLALTILLGFQAPNLWHSQELIIKKIVDKKINEILGEKLVTESTQHLYGLPMSRNKSPQGIGRITKSKIR
jgi:hypothetical protein